MSIITINDIKLQANIVGNNLIAFNWIDRVLVASQWLFIIYSFSCGTVNSPILSLSHGNKFLILSKHFFD